MDITMEDPYSNLAAEEAIFRLNRLPTLRVWDNQLSVIIGRAQLARFETDPDYCEAHRIPVVRRFTAGGAVYNGPGNLNWSFLAPASSEHRKIRYTSDPRSVFSSFASIIVEALAACSVACRFVPPNRLDTEEGKVSGMAAYISKEGVICHGTLLLDADLAEVARLTNPSVLAPETRYPRSSFVRVANTKINRDAFVKCLTVAADLDLDSCAMTEEEEQLTQSFRKKYVRKEWSLGDPFALNDSQFLC